MTSAVATRRRQRWLAPEVVQTSAMDCGPATLKCLLEGFHIPVSYGRLREACQTDVDGTSIDTIEVVANQLGVTVESAVAVSASRAAGRPPIDSATVTWIPPHSSTSLTNCGANTV